MKSVKYTMVAVALFGLSESVTAKSACYYVCNKTACKVKEAQGFCFQHCKDKDTVNCRKQHAKPAKEVAASVRKAACDKAFNRISCKDGRVAQIASKICPKDRIKNCLKAAPGA